jgi:hypothetical protein
VITEVAAEQDDSKHDHGCGPFCFAHAVRYRIGRAAARTQAPVHHPEKGYYHTLWEVIWASRQPSDPVALKHDYDMVRLGVAPFSASTATVLFAPSSTRVISELVMHSRRLGSC